MSAALVTTATIMVVSVNDPPGPIADGDGMFISVFETVQIRELPCTSTSMWL